MKINLDKKINIKIAHFTSAHSREDPRIFHKECISANKKFDVSLIVSDGFGDSIKENVKIFDIGKMNNRLKRIIFSPYYFIKFALKNKFSIIHLHDPELLIVSPFLFWKSRIIFDFHEDIKNQFEVRNYLNKLTKFLLYISYSLYEKIIMLFLSGVVCATPEIYKKYNNFKKKIILNNFPIKKNYSNLLNIKKTNSIVYVGVITPERGIYEAIKSISLTKSKPKFLIIGKCFDKKFLSKIKSCDEFKYVEMMGWKSYNEIPEIISNCKAGIATLHPKKNYLKSQPTKIFEYLASGIPAIVSNFDYWKNLLGEDQNMIYVNPLSPKEIAVAIDNICLDNYHRLMIEVNKSDFFWENEEQKLLNFYEKLVYEKN